jgi:hypothetical protein
MHSVCVVELHVTVNNIKVLSVTQQCFYSKFMSPTTTQITNNVEECGPCPVFVSFTLFFALQLRKKN